MLNMLFAGYFTSEAIKYFCDEEYGWGIACIALVAMNIVCAFN